MLKKGLKSIAIVILVFVMLFSMVACGNKLSGTYTNSEGLVKLSYTFKEDNIVETNALGIDLKWDGLKIEYEIEKGKITFTYSVAGLSYDKECDFEKKGNSIFIDGKEFIKEK